VPSIHAAELGWEKKRYYYSRSKRVHLLTAAAHNPCFHSKTKHVGCASGTLYAMLSLRQCSPVCSSGLNHRTVGFWVHALQLSSCSAHKASSTKSYSSEQQTCHTQQTVAHCTTRCAIHSGMLLAQVKGCPAILVVRDETSDQTKPQVMRRLEELIVSWVTSSRREAAAKNKRCAAFARESSSSARHQTSLLQQSCSKAAANTLKSQCLVITCNQPLLHTDTPSTAHNAKSLSSCPSSVCNIITHKP
jgi:hypothetical protein